MTAWDFTTCFAVTEEHIARATAPSAGPDDDPRERVVSLLQRMAKVAKPRQGAPKILLVLGRLAGAAWLGGALDIRVTPDADWSTIEVFVDDGASVTRFCAPLAVGVPMDELARAVEMHPDALAPLALVGAASPRKLRLRAEVEASPRRSARPPSARPPAKSVRPGAGRSSPPQAKSVRSQPPRAKASTAPSRPPAPPAQASNAPRPHASSAPRPPPPPKPVVPAAPKAPVIGVVPPAPARTRAPSDVTATIRKTVEPPAGARPEAGPRPARPGPRDVKATVKVSVVRIPKEAIGGDDEGPLPEIRIGASRGGAVVPRDEDELPGSRGPARRQNGKRPRPEPEALFAYRDCASCRRVVASSR